MHRNVHLGCYYAREVRKDFIICQSERDRERPAVAILASDGLVKELHHVAGLKGQVTRQLQVSVNNQRDNADKFSKDRGTVKLLRLLITPANLKPV